MCPIMIMNECHICTEKKILIQLPLCRHKICNKCWYTITKLSIDKPKCPFCRTEQPVYLSHRIISWCKDILDDIHVNLIFFFLILYCIYRNQNFQV